VVYALFNHGGLVELPAARVGVGVFPRRPASWCGSQCGSGARSGWRGCALPSFVLVAVRRVPAFVTVPVLVTVRVRVGVWVTVFVGGEYWSAYASGGGLPTSG
jgi:hypothetical protein